MKHKDLIKLKNRINEYQEEGYFHPFTCRRDDCRVDLVATIKDKDVILLCPNCKEEQKEYPLKDLFLDDKQWEETVVAIKEMRAKINKIVGGAE